MTNPPQEDRFGPGLKALLICLLILGLLVAGGIVGRPAYRSFQEKRALQMARQCRAASDDAGASICARRALAANPGSLEAVRIMAELAQKSGSPLLMHWRQRLADLEPTLGNKLSLARVAMKEQGPPFPLATEVLASVTKEGQGSSEYQSLAGQLALLQNRKPDAEKCFLAAARLEPENQSHTLNLAVLHLKSTDTSERAGAQTTLERLAGSTNLDGIALRWLVSDAVSSHNFGLAESYSSRLNANTNGHATLEDRLRHAEIILQTRPSDFPSLVQSLRTLSETNASQIQTVSAWMASKGMAQEAFEWLMSLPKDKRKRQPVALAIAACCALNGDWRKLEDYLQGQDWGETEFLRLGYLGKAATESGRERDANLCWDRAFQRAGDQLGPLLLLANMASQFQNAKAREDLLWQIVRRHPHQKWASQELEKACAEKGNTEKLRYLYSILATYEPQNYRVRNNFVATSLLVKKDLIAAHESAQELYTAHPKDPIIASTYAFSLHLQGRSKEGLSVLEHLGSANLMAGNVSLYYGILLSANGKNEMAEKLLLKTEKDSLLPEESALRKEALGKRVEF